VQFCLHAISFSARIEFVCLEQTCKELCEILFSIFREVTRYSLVETADIFEDTAPSINWRWWWQVSQSHGYMSAGHMSAQKMVILSSLLFELMHFTTL